MYTYRYINKFYQFGRTYCTLILYDPNNVFKKTVRIEKKFTMDQKLIDDDFLCQEAQKEIEGVLAEQATIELLQVEENI